MYKYLIIILSLVHFSCAKAPNVDKTSVVIDVAYTMTEVPVWAMTTRAIKLTFENYFSEIETVVVSLDAAVEIQSGLFDLEVPAGRYLRIEFVGVQLNTGSEENTAYYGFEDYTSFGGLIFEPGMVEPVFLEVAKSKQKANADSAGYDINNPHFSCVAHGSLGSAGIEYYSHETLGGLLIAPISSGAIQYTYGLVRSNNYVIRFVPDDSCLLVGKNTSFVFKPETDSVNYGCVVADPSTAPDNSCPDVMNDFQTNPMYR